MENKYLIDLSLKHGLDSEQVSKIVDIIYQFEFTEVDSKEAQKLANYICEKDLHNLPIDEIIAEINRKDLFG